MTMLSQSQKVLQGQERINHVLNSELAKLLEMWNTVKKEKIDNIEKRAKGAQSELQKTVDEVTYN